MRIHLRILTLLACILAVVSCARAQSDPAAWEDDPRNPKNFHTCTLSGGAGYSAIAGKDRDNFRGEWNFQAGAGFAVKRSARRPLSLFLNFDYLYEHASVKSAALAQARNLNPTNIALLNATGGTANFNLVAIDPTLRISASKNAEAYFFGGFGYFRRQVDLTGPSAQGALIQPGNPAVFLRNSSSGSVDGGAGINFKKKGFPMPYAEVRVVHGLAINHSTTLIPVSVGIRW